MTSRVLNFLWLNLDFPAPPDPADGTIRQPMPENYIENVRQAAKRHPDTQVELWVDSKRLTEKQLTYMTNAIEAELPNVHLKDLRSIPAYDSEDLYNEAETNPYWRDPAQNSLIWRQVDCAKILISLQGNHDQTFFADMDRSHVNLDAAGLQQMLAKRGVMFGSRGSFDPDIENQLWGFTPQWKPFFENYYIQALQDAYDGRNAYARLLSLVASTLESVKLTEYSLLICPDLTEAHHPGHKFDAGGMRNAFNPLTIEYKGAPKQTTAPTGKKPVPGSNPP